MAADRLSNAWGREWRQEETFLAPARPEKEERGRSHTNKAKESLSLGLQFTIESLLTLTMSTKTLEDTILL